jgi:hypothetical protein
MPVVRFQQKERVEQWWSCSCEVPQEVIDEGDDALRDYIMREAKDSDLEYHEVEFSSTEEDFIDVDRIAVD